MCACTQFKAFKEWQLSKLDRHIHDNQYFLGEKEHHEISWTDAEYDFFMNYNKKVGCELRNEYCSTVCKDRKTCVLGKMFESTTKQSEDSQENNS